ncbi:hypothetical protein AKJ65_04545 [candidate division MSBL1 archaeon SCGC-AAA259E19]|uniref:Uncharacterized protein n=1 Tax=candidate division MSBL1 archaeon SCGC-AAA259E19 TaxID=1698264 RepID=A0A133UJH7_9EURY|nr:hypothetical protein AKJ65_04545 [candidate division MSBL1 archaeon SCGC-AAA259E19]
MPLAAKPRDLPVQCVRADQAHQSGCQIGKLRDRSGKERIEKFVHGSGEIVRGVFENPKNHETGRNYFNNLRTSRIFQEKL